MLEKMDKEKEKERNKQTNKQTNKHVQLDLDGIFLGNVTIFAVYLEVLGSRT